MGVPVLGSEFGAVGDRLQAHGGGWVVPVDNVDVAYRMILRVVQSPEHYNREAGRACLQHVRTVSEMAKDYEEMYMLLLAESQGFHSADRTR